MLVEISSTNYPQEVLERFWHMRELLAELTTRINTLYNCGYSKHSDYNTIFKLQLRNLLDDYRIVNKAAFSLYLDLRDLGQSEKAQRLLRSMEIQALPGTLTDQQPAVSTRR